MSDAFSKPLKELEEEQKKAAKQREADHKAIFSACGAEFPPPSTIVGCAAIIVKLREQRDDAIADAKAKADHAAEYKKSVSADITSAVAGDLAREASHVMPAAKTIKELRSELDSAKAKHEKFIADVRGTLADHAMSLIPGLSAYFGGEKPKAAKRRR